MSRKFRLDRAKTLDFLEELASTESEAISLYLARGTTQDRAESLLGKVSIGNAVPPDVATAAAGSQTGGALFLGTSHIYAVMPPFPITEEYVTHGYDIGPLRSLLSQEFLIALVLVRLGAYSIGVCRGTELVDSRTGTGLVHARHKKGGSSQARFARHREKQIEMFLTRVCGHARERIEPHARALDYLVYGGARTTILSLRKRCPFLNQFDDRILRMLADIPDPRLPVLEKAIHTVWSTDVIEWCEDSSQLIPARAN